jgi:rubrerythrin
LTAKDGRSTIKAEINFGIHLIGGNNMSKLLTCPDCGKQVEKGIPICPSCGAKIKQPKVWLWVLLGVVIVGGIIKIIVFF